jgi:galactokinase
MSAATMAATRDGLHAAAVSACAPGRLCLAGESLDWMTGGPSVVAAVPLHTEVTISRGHRAGPVLLRSAEANPTSRAVSVSDLAHYAGDSLDYMQATAKVVTGFSPLLISGATIEARSSVPIGAGLSSSAALTVATAAALMRFAAGGIPPASDVARAAYSAEAGELETGAGWMDFLACTHGGVSRIDADESRATRLSGSLGAPLVLIDTMQRRTTRAVLASKRDRYRSGEPGMRTYADAATRIVAEMTVELRASAPNLARVGSMITEGHTLLRDLVHCSTELIDECVRRCLAAGAYGAKLTGSGHGGCLFALAPLDTIGPVLAALRALPVRVMVFTTSESHGVVFPPSEC